MSSSSAGSTTGSGVAVEPVAVVGLSCRFPSAGTPEAFAELLAAGTDALIPVPPNRWCDSDGEPGAARAGFVENVASFDAELFGISPREAAAMDPQQRFALELSWELLENAGITPNSLARSRAGVFVGAIADDYANLRHRAGVVDHHSLTGSHRSLIANRISYFFGLRGPSMVVDSGQSSSLVAVHLACQSLRAGECRAALAGGVNLNLSAETTVAVDRFGGLSPDGRCFTFDSRANGYARGEGGGFVLLKPLSAALADGDTVHAVLRGSAINNDGGGDGLTAPDRAAQQEVLRLAYEVAAVDPAAVQYVELHGTGTALGDPVEAAALGAVLGRDRSPDRPLRVGSVKTNIGHLEGAAGIAGLLKVVLAIRDGLLPVSLNFAEPNPAIDFDAWRLRVQTESSSWPASDTHRLAGVSAFGMGGTNAHVVVEQAPHPRQSAPAEAPAPIHWSGVLPWPLSAQSRAALRKHAARLHEHVTTTECDTAAVGWTLATTRTALPHRAVVLADDAESFHTGVRALADGDPAAHVVEGTVPRDVGHTVFVFPGQGSQWIGMASELLDTAPVFAEAVRECADALAAHIEWDLVAVLRGEAEVSLDRVEVVQPALWAMMVSLARLWRSVGVEPTAVVGHSQGEIAAACFSGAMTLADGARLVALRSRVIAENLSGHGGMLSVAAAIEDVERELAGHPGVEVATVNGPAATVVAGGVEELAAFGEACASQGFRTRTIAVDYASHSAQVERISSALHEIAAPIRSRPGAVPFYSTVTGDLLDATELNADYWYRNLREPVRFHDTVRRLAAAAPTAFVEVSPHPVLVTSITEAGQAARVPLSATATLRREDGGPRRFLTSVAEAWLCGAEPDWTAVFAGHQRGRVALPTYPFEQREHWFGHSQHRSVPVSGQAQEPPAEQEPAGSAAIDTTRVVRAQAAAVLGHGSGGELDVSRTFKDLGFDSIMLGELCGRINTALGTSLTVSALFDHPTLEALTAHLEPGQPQAVATTGPSVSTEEPIAVVAMACRLPGGVESPEDLWRLLANGEDAITPFPTDRGWDLDRLHRASGPGGVETDGGGFLAEAADFDAGFFGLSPREALGMDPQQRLLLEVSWEAFERAGMDPTALRGTDTGVFVGTMDQEYGPRLHEAPAELDGFLLTGKTTSVASGRIAYLLGLTGPAITLDTACSSSLVALHLAINSLRRGETSLALAGGVTVLATPGIFTEFSTQGGLARDGRCKAFAAAADGTGMAEGAGMLVLQRLSDAQRQGRTVLGVLRGSAVNSDGASNGLTAPSGAAQQRVIRAALADAGLGQSDVDVVEAHGTGTALGDPIEAEALLATYGRDRDRPLLLGSLKSNIGHTQAAAGVAGIIKMVLALDRGKVPATLHVDEPSTRVDWATGAVELVTSPADWPAVDRPRRGGVSSFGISGTNAHVVLEQAPAGPPAPAADAANPLAGAVVPWVVSGRSAAGLRAQAHRLAEFAPGSGDPVSVGLSLATGRAAFEHRAVVLASDRAQFAAGMAAVAAGGAGDGVVAGEVLRRGSGRVVFVFPGQGSQWVGMGRDLLDSSPVFARSMAECEEALAPFVDWSLTAVLRADAVLERVDVVQPVLWAVMVSLAAWWESAGVTPAAVVGHSQGEIAAACVSGVLSLEDGARLVALRSQVIARDLAGDGGMLSLATGTEHVLGFSSFGEDAAIAAINSPRSTVVAGTAEALSAIEAEAVALGVRARRIPVDYASHSAHVDRIRPDLLERIGKVEPREGTVPLFSTTVADWVAGPDLDAEYWYRNLREPVRFQDAIRALLADHLFVEVSAHPVLVSAIEEIGHADGVPATAIGTLRRDDGGTDRLLTSLSELWVHGVMPDWHAVFGRGVTASANVPTTAFVRDRYWLASTGSGSEVRVELPAMRTREVTDGFTERISAAADDAQRTRAVLAEIRAHAAAVLGWDSADKLEADRTFRDLGFDSLTGVQLSKRLSAATGQRLSPTAVFDHPTPQAMAEQLSDLTLGAAALDTDTAACTDEPLAIVATGCRFPGGVRSPEELWELLLSGRDAIEGFPADRGWNLEELGHPDRTRPGASSVDRGGFLRDAAGFDPGFFGISPREALAMDPQQRHLLEVSWETIERAGVDPRSLRGSRTGVFVGLVPHGYDTVAAAEPNTSGYVFTGAAGSVASGRIAYTLGLTGPAVTVDTACSSSLVALHLAMQALRAGECSLALAGGATVMSTPNVFVEFSHQGALAPDGRCKPFAAAADGTAWSEGVGVLMLERLSDARRNGHDVLAIVRGSAVNQDGASNGLTAPNGPSQQRVIRQALANARLRPQDVEVVEAHGTGTSLGDPIEAQALLTTYGLDRAQPLLVGSLKSVLGHASAAAGVAGVIKMVEALRHGVVPATLHVDEPSPFVDWSAGKVDVVTENQPWPESAAPRRAAVSAFGVSGTNAHVILEQAVEPAEPVVADAPVGAMPWMLSASSPAALTAQAGRLHAFTDTVCDPASVGWSLATGRAGLAHRAVVIADELSGYREGLAAVAGVGVSKGVVAGEVLGRGSGRVVFVFPGQGSQWAGMASSLLESSAVFGEAFDRCAAALAPFVDWDVRGALSDEVSLERVDVVQPILWAVMLSLAETWRSVGVVPDVVVGHSQGEIAAACVSGVLSLEDGARLVALRSQVIARHLAGDGGMLSLAAGSCVADELVSRHDNVWIATLNGPESTVLAGELAALEEIHAEAEKRGLRPRRIPVDYASHTPHVEPLRDRLLDLAAPISARPGHVPFYSTVTACRVGGTELDASYWYRNLRETVRFEETIEKLIVEGDTAFLEVSPHPVLTPAVHDIARQQEADIVATGTLRRGEGGTDRMLRSLAELWVRGVEPDWDRVFAGTGARRVLLPTYAFQHSRFWPRSSGEKTGPEQGDPYAEFWRLVERQDLEAIARMLRVEGGAGFGEVVDALAGWRRDSVAGAEMDRLRYRVGWEHLTSGSPAVLPPNWVVVTDDARERAALADDLAGALRARGAVVETVLADDPDIGERVARYGEIDGIVSVLALGAAVRPDAEEVHRTLRLVRTASAPVWCLTQGAVSTDPLDAVSAPAQALIWGLGRVAAQEFPEHWGGLVDLPSEVDARVLEQLCEVLAQRDEDQVAIRPGGALGRRLFRAGFRREPDRNGWDPGSGTILITGGTGALGSQVARRLARRGTHHLVLASRRGANAAGAAELEAELTTLGARVTIVACDLADPEALAGLVAEHPPSAVFHTAAVLDDGALDGLTAEQIDRVLRVKADVALRLHELTCDRELSAFVLFSSLSGTIGLAGQGNYAPGNAYLDALAHHRRSLGLPAISLAWGSWAQGGMAESEAVVATQLRHGVPLLEPESALDAMEIALAHDDPDIVIADVDWARFSHAYTALRSSTLLEYIAEAAMEHKEPSDRAGSAALAEELAGLKPAERSRKLLDTVRGEVAAVLGHNSAEAIGTRRPFLELGLDSVTAVDLRNRLDRATGLRLPATVVFDQPDAVELAAYLEDQLTLREDSPAAEPPVTALLESSSNDELFEFIEKEFGIS
ncbi:type I polyketide synthase [Prauserella cavernicola]|uniref:6-deoxyerythronolide-B synthase n=1 Tax=Prauserella cavernicola TaxID=2800127 RepID=A0A934V7C3_9PSEU|nr:type I polyketide synthase [Prauserella cavernicola]MBK1786598.1 SDR family NAD(P)-dependent oxidoreductase [Prauserella cavernicola]